MSTNPKKSPKRQAPQPVPQTGKPVVPKDLSKTTAEIVSPSNLSNPPTTVPISSKDSPQAVVSSTLSPVLSDGNSNTTEDKKDVESELESETGGLSAFHKVDQIISRVVSKVEDEIKAQINELRKSDSPLKKTVKLEIEGYRSIVVAGFLYFAKIKIPGDSFIQARILETPKGDISLQSVTETKTIADEEEYFKLPKSTKLPETPAATAIVAPITSSPENDKENESNKEDLESELQTGGLSIFRDVDHVITRVVSKVEDEIKEKINELRKEDPPLDNTAKLEIVGYRSNIVAGYIYFAKIKISGDSFIQARILETLKGDISLQSVTETKTSDDEKEYFKLP